MAIGMVLACKIGEKLGITPAHVAPTLEEILLKYGLPVKLELSAADLMDEIKWDKKNLSGSLSFVVLEEIGESLLHPISPRDLGLILEEVAGK